MKKRLSNSEHRRQVRKKTMKKRQQLMKSAVDEDSIGLWPGQKMMVLNFLLVGLIIFIFIPFHNVVPQTPEVKVVNKEIKTTPVATPKTKISKKSPEKKASTTPKNISKKPNKPYKEVISIVKNPSMKKVTEEALGFKATSLAKTEEATEETIYTLESTSTKRLVRDVSDIKQIESEKIGKLRKEISSIVKDAPMKEMINDIAVKDRQIAAFLVGIALKESHFGRHSPKDKNGDDCYNYWGYRGRENTTASGYSCFDSPSHAIEVVGRRIESLVDQGRTTPAKMVVWKCGYSCDAFTPESVDSWINDVSINYYKLNPGGDIAKN